MSILVLVEHDNQTLKTSTLHTVTAAKKISDDITAFVIGYQCSLVAEAASKIAGVKRVLCADSVVYQYQLAEDVVSLLQCYSNQFQYILSPATTFGKNCLPRLAALFDVGMISDIIDIVDADTFLRPIYAGNALATVKTLDPIKFITVRSAAFTPVTAEQPAATIEVIDTATIEQQSMTTFIRQELNESDRPDLTDATVVISGGRGLKSQENFAMLEELADKMGAAIGASRAAVDAGFISNDYQVGQTGKVVAPELYIAVGISGAIQHLAGMKDSKIIVAINKDSDAPIFKIADYGLVGDLFEIIPELSRKIL